MAANDDDTAAGGEGGGRAARRRREIVDALLDLLGAGNAAPSAAEIAGAADISVRSLFRHFGDFRRLYLAAADRVVSRMLPQLVELDLGGSLGDRIARFVERRVAFCESVAQLARIALQYDPDSQDAQQRINAGRFFSRNLVERAFAAELSVLPEPQRGMAVESVLLASDWDTWARLRRSQGLDLAAARAIMARLIRVALMDCQTPEIASAEIVPLKAAGQAGL